MTKRVTVNSSYQPVSASSSDAAYEFDADDVRLEKYQTAAKAAYRAEGKPMPAPAAETDGGVERVGTERKGK